MGGEGSAMTHDHEMSLSDFADVLRRRWRMIAWPCVIALALGGAASRIVPPVYRASATVAAAKVPPIVVIDQPGLASSLAEHTDVGLSDVSTLGELAKSETVREDATARLSSVMGPAAAKAVLRGLRVQQPRGTELLRISVEHRDPATAARAANAVVASLIDLDLASRRGRATEERQSIEQQLVVVVPELQRREDALAAFKSEHGDVSLADQTVSSLNKLAQLEAQRVDVDLQRQEAQARLTAGRSRLSDQAQIAPVQWVPSPLITTLQNQLATQEIELSGLRRQFTPKHPMVINVEARIEETKRRLDAEMTRNLQVGQYGVDPTYQTLVQQVKQDEVGTAALDARSRALAGAIAEYDEKVRQLPAREVELARLTRRVKEAEETHQLLSEKLEQARVAEASVGSAVRVMDAARAPEKPVWHWWLGIVVGGVLGLLLGTGGAMVKEQVEDPLRFVGDAGRMLGAPILGSIPGRGASLQRGQHDADSSVPSATNPRPHLLGGLHPATRSQHRANRERSAIAEAFRCIRTNLVALRTQPLRALLVTSPGLDEAKDAVAANLAIALAQGGRRTWLVECDLRRPALDRAWELQDPKPRMTDGLSEALEAARPIETALRPTAVTNMWFLPAGKRPTNPAELLGGQSMRSFLERQREDAPVIVLDGPAVLPVADAAVLGPLVDGVLLVVEIGKTPRVAVARAREQLEAVGARVLGVIAIGQPLRDLGGGYYARSAQHYHSAASFEAWHFGPRQ